MMKVLVLISHGYCNLNEYLLTSQYKKVPGLNHQGLEQASISALTGLSGQSGSPAA